MHKIYSLLSKKAQAYVETMELKEVLNILFFMNNENFTRRDKEKLIAVHETILEYNTKEDIKEIRSPKEAYDFLKPKFIGNEQEEFHAIFLNTKNRIIHTEMVFKGSTNTCIVDPKCLYSRALKCSASAVIVAHSHPRSDPTPSKVGVEVIRSFSECGDLIGEQNYNIANPGKILLKENIINDLYIRLNEIRYSPEKANLLLPSYPGPFFGTYEYDRLYHSYINQAAMDFYHAKYIDYYKYKLYYASDW